MNNKDIVAVFGRLDELLDRVTRLETRMVVFMQFMGCDKHGRELPQGDDLK
jgi:hypothetical protein